MKRRNWKLLSHRNTHTTTHTIRRDAVLLICERDADVYMHKHVSIVVCVCARALGLPPSRIYFHFVFRVEMHHSHMRTTGDQTKGFSYRFFFSIFSLVSLYTSRRIAFAFYARTDSKLHIERPLHVFGSVFRIRGDDVRILFIFMYIDKN